jgi:hypothetical protein
MASCSLSGDGMARQGARYAALAPSVVRAEHSPRRLVVEFGPGYDRALLDEAIAVERECCPFFAIEVGEGRLEIVLAEGEDTLLLDGIAAALGSGVSPTARVS